MNDEVTPRQRKQSLYFPAETLDEVKHEAQRLDRSLSWVVQRAWRLARPQIKQLRPVE